MFKKKRGMQFSCWSNLLLIFTSSHPMWISWCNRNVSLVHKHELCLFFTKPQSFDGNPRHGSIWFVKNVLLNNQSKTSDFCFVAQQKIPRWYSTMHSCDPLPSVTSTLKYSLSRPFSKPRNTPRGRLNIKLSSYQYMDPHIKDKTVSRPYSL